MNDPQSELLLVYNADGGVFSRISDAVHKIVAPNTYPCSLCAVTHGPVAMRRKWRVFLEQLPNRTVFYHKNDFAGAYPDTAIALPAMLSRLPGKQPEVLLSKQDLDAIDTIDTLIAQLQSRLSAD